MHKQEIDYKQFVIIVAGGLGVRMGTSTPKQFLCINNKPILMHTIQKFYNYNNLINIIIALPNEHFSTWENLCLKYNFNIKHTIISGGDTRYQSVKNGLKAISSKGLIAVHDAVRPLVSTNLIAKCYNEALKNDNAIPCIGVSETIREIDENTSKQLNRNNIKLIQTPQVFDSEMLQTAYKSKFKNNFTDDASVIERAGFKLNFIEGEKQNIKITTDLDLKLAEFYMSYK